MTTRLEAARRALPARLAERTRWIGPAGDAPRFVLYWMRTAVRAHENPALDAAACLAAALDAPLFVYHAVSERYPYASDRHHTFLLEGARDVAAQLAARGVGYALHVERPGHRGPHLRALAADAGLVVTEDLPVPPLAGWTAALARRAEVPVALVDTACVVPMRLTSRPARAFEHRRATAALREARLRDPYEDAPIVGPRFVPPLPFEPVDLGARTIAPLVAECDIDHTVGPVSHTPGGTAAGMARWRRFLDGPIQRYAYDRNDALLDGTSRMSAYLHMGFVSPFRLAREAAALDGEGPDKFLDELLVWREIAHSFCFHTPELGSLEALPAWARATLEAHAHDERRAVDREALARGRTGEPLWDAAQTSLLRHGELHNNVRMTWGKALLDWTRDPAAALEALIDLNHRYALDGRDPASYGGLLWCLGLFDRPFEPEAPVRGTLRPRPPRQHAKRLDVAAYRAKVTRPAVRRGPVAVIGAGIAGLTCARALHDHGVEVIVFDKGRRVGGRLNTRREDGHAYDHGAQFVTAKDPRLVRLARAWLERGVLARWEFRERDGAEEQTTRRLVGAGSMRRLAEHLAEDLDVRCGVRVAPLTPGGPLQDEGGEPLGRFDAVVVTAPLTQASALLAAYPALGARLAEGRHAPCWATMVTFAERLDTDLDAIRGAGPIAWAARDSSKPGRPGGERWVIHRSVAESARTLEHDAEEVATRSIADLVAALGVDAPEILHRRAHRWRYARVERALGAPCLFDPDSSIAVAGDGLLGPRVEAAFLSGAAAAGRLLGG